jgi:hypothetical protein
VGLVRVADLECSLGEACLAPRARLMQEAAEADDAVELLRPVADRAVEAAP